jgi:ferredoxin
MGPYILYKDHRSYWLRQLRKEADLIGPLKKDTEDVVYERVEQIHEIVTEGPTLLPSIKEFFLPQWEIMFFHTDSTVKTPLEDRKRVLFGVRSCDVSALKILDRFFLQGYKDTFYEKKRANTLVISIVCKDPEETCFCNSLGTGPYLQKNFDIQLTDLSDRYLVEIASTKGKKAVEEFRFLFQRPKTSDYDEQFEIQLSAKARFQKNISLEKVSRVIKSGISDEFWQGIAERCIRCGGCVFQCPLCSCYSIQDRNYGDHIERARLWDACLFKGFTVLAGKHFPHPEQTHRTKRWFYHKLLYYPETLGSFGCVGCGRCTKACPTKIDMASVAMKNKSVDEAQDERQSLSTL